MAKKSINQQKDLKEQLARSLADYQNLEKRFEKERLDVIQRANKALMQRLLPVLDLLERAQNHLKDSGLQMAIDQFHQVLAESGVEKIKVEVGDEFKSTEHEAIETVSGGKAHTVAAVLRSGYKWQDGMVLQPARVRVFTEKRVDNQLKNKEN